MSECAYHGLLGQERIVIFARNHPDSLEDQNGLNKFFGNESSLLSYASGGRSGDAGVLRK